VREKHGSQLEIYDRLPTSEQADPGDEKERSCLLTSMFRWTSSLSTAMVGPILSAHSNTTHHAMAKSPFNTTVRKKNIRIQNFRSNPPRGTSMILQVTGYIQNRRIKK